MIQLLQLAVLCFILGGVAKPHLLRAIADISGVGILFFVAWIEILHLLSVLNPD